MSTLNKLIKHTYENLIIRFNNDDEYLTFDKLIQKIHNDEWETNVLQCVNEYPFFVSFNVSDEKDFCKKGVVINIDDILMYYCQTSKIVFPNILNMKDPAKIEYILNNIQKKELLII